MDAFDLDDFEDAIDQPQKQDLADARSRGSACSASKEKLDREGGNGKAAQGEREAGSKMVKTMGHGV
jgi:hypothetical protein